MIDFWWVFGVGTIVFLTLTIGLIGSVVYSQRTKLRLEREKYASLLQSERKYSDLFHNVTDIVYIHSLDGKLLDINRTAEVLTGFQPAEVLGKSLSDFIPHRHRNQFSEYLRRLNDRVPEERGVLPFLHKNKRRLVILEYRSSLIGEEGSLVAVRGIARDVTDVMGNARQLRLSERRASALLQKSTEMQMNLQLLSGRILQMSEEERRHISRELHDEVGQLLTGLSMNLEVVRKTLPENSSEVRELIIKAQELTEKVLEQIHSFLVELRPAVLDELGLLPAIRNLASTFQGRSPIQVSVSGDPSIETLGNDQKMVLYRVVQESLTNAMKHSEAENVNIDLQRVGNSVTLEINDNGRGFEMAVGDAANRNGNRRLGILGMKERVKLIEGTLDISSKENHGTRVMIRIPIAMNGAQHG